MASTAACFLHCSTPAAAARTSSQHYAPPSKHAQLLCRAHKQADDDGIVSRRLALTVLIGAAAVGSRVSPADAAYGESGT